MGHLLTIFFASVFTSNMIFSNFLSMCSFISVSNEVETATGLGIAVIFVLTITTTINYFIYRILLYFNIEYLAILVFIIVIAAFVQVLEMLLDRFIPNLYYALGIFLPLITVNCAILGASQFMVSRQFGFMETVFFSLGSGIGWAMAIILLAGIRQRINEDSIPSGLRGTPITLLTTGIMALGFMGLAGML